MSSQAYAFKSQQPNPENSGVADIDPAELWAQRELVTIIDVRQPDEYSGELGHVPGSHLVVLNTLPEMLPSWDPQNPIVFVCRSGARSGRAAAFAKDQGFLHVYNMKGGMLLWNELQLETARESQD